MMLRPLLARLALLAALALLPAALAAQPVVDGVVAQLRDQGYVEFEVSRTLLGRVQVIALGPLGRREIVFNPTTGEILRDLLRPSGAGLAPMVLDRGDPAGPQEGGFDEPAEGGAPSGGQEDRGAGNGGNGHGGGPGNGNGGGNGNGNAGNGGGNGNGNAGGNGNGGNGGNGNAGGNGNGNAGGADNPGRGRGQPRGGEG